MMESPDKMPYNRAVMWILLSTLLVSGSALMATLYYMHVKELRLQNNQYRIVAIVQNCQNSEALKTSYLAQLLDLSLDKPINLYQFDNEEGVAKLLACPLIKTAGIQKIRPGALYIQYLVRTPLAYLGDYSNTAIDTEGFLIPFQPFFTPKKLPTIYLGCEGEWGKSLAQDQRLQLAFTLLKKLEIEDFDHFYVKQIDVTDAFSDSFGKRQIVVTLASLSNNKSYLLRLNSDEYEQSLANFHALKDRFRDRTSPFTIIDLRIPQLAFIKPRA